MNKDNKNIFQAYVTENEMSDKDKIMSKLKHLAELLPGDAHVEWSIQDGSFSGLTAQAVGGEKTIHSLIDTLSKMWSDESYAQELGMTDADWSGADNSSGSIFWTANDTHYHDAFEDKSHDQFQRLKPEYKEQYNTFNKHKHLADAYVIKLMGGRPVMREPVGEVTPETFEHQKHWRISLSPKSKSIDDRGDATYDSVGYGKGRYMGD